MAVGAALLALGAALVASAGAENRRYVRDFISESQALVGDVEATRTQLASSLGGTGPGGRPVPPRQPTGSLGSFDQQSGGSIDRIIAKMRKLSEGRQRAEKTLSAKEAQFTAEVQGDLRRMVQQLSLSQVTANDAPDRRALFYGDLGRQAEAVRRKLREYQ